MKIFGKFGWLIFLSLFIATKVNAEINLARDTIKSAVNVAQQKDTVIKKDPMRSVWLGAIIPGYGQIANKKYWKLPIVYGGFIGCSFAISWNASRYASYRQAYIDITDTDNSTNSFLEIIPAGYTIDSYGGVSNFTSRLKTGMEQARYNRDMSVIVSVAYVALTLVDAYVDAQLADFDISPDLSMKFKPSLMQDNTNFTIKNQNKALGLSLKLKF